MQGTSAATRAVYRPSGKVRGSQFLLGFLASAAVAIVMAWCLAFSLRKGFYFYCLVPLLASLPVLGVWFASLSWSHCRNKTLATGASIVLAALLYFGYFHFALLDLIGIRNVQRVDLLPHYVRMRMQTDVPQDLRFAQPARRQPPGIIDEVFNWMFFAFDLATVTAVTVLLGRYCVSRAYCESCDTWMKRATLKLAPGQGTKVWQALQAGDVHAIPRMLAAAPNGAASGELSVAHCPVCQAEGGLQVVYLTVKDVPLSGARIPIQTQAAAFFKPRHTVRLQSLANHVVLDPDEVQALVPMFPALGDFGNDALVVAPEELPTRFLRAQVEDGQIREWRGRLARVEPVDPADAGLVLTRRNAVLQTIIGVFSIFGGFGLALGPEAVVHYLDIKTPEWVSALLVCWMFGIIVLNLLWMLFFPTYLTTRFMLRQTRHAFQCRLNPAVDVHDPDLIFVDIVPRINWDKEMMENATDIDFLKLDAQRRS